MNLMRVASVAFALIGTMGVLSATTEAKADWDHRGYDHHWYGPRWGWRGPAYYYGYAPPPAYYPPPPVVYAPPPPPVYYSPGVSFGLTIR